jgi:ribosome-binding factor A|tara:strand:+ start:180 stop:413 length:234 start_codon:yes stop_codon:yes gene_type:complete
MTKQDGKVSLPSSDLVDARVYIGIATRAKKKGQITEVIKALNICKDIIEHSLGMLVQPKKPTDESKQRMLDYFDNAL